MFILLTVSAILGPSPAIAGSWSRIDKMTLKFSGEILDGDEVAFFKILTPEDNTIIVDSEGGYTGAGVVIGMEIFKRGINIVVDGECLSSCANYLFIGAQNKFIRRGYVGFHGSTKQMLDPIPMKEMEEEMRTSGSSENEIQKELNRGRQIGIREAIFFKLTGVDISLFEVSYKEDKGSGHGRPYAFLVPKLETFKNYNIQNVSGVVDINVDPDFTQFIYLK